jgi:polyhydroxyalkanoate synthesis regulator phasin
VLEPIEELKAYNNVTEAGLFNQILGRFFGDEDSPEMPLARGARKVIDDITETGQKAIDMAKDYVDSRIRSINTATQIVSGNIRRKVGEAKQAERVKDKEMTIRPSTVSTYSDRGAGRSFKPTGTKASSVSKARTSVAKKKGERL